MQVTHHTFIKWIPFVGIAIVIYMLAKCMGIVSGPSSTISTVISEEQIKFESWPLDMKKKIEQLDSQRSFLDKLNPFSDSNPHWETVSSFCRSIHPLQDFYGVLELGDNPKIIHDEQTYYISSTSLDGSDYANLIHAKNGAPVRFHGTTKNERSVTKSGFLDKPEWDIELTGFQADRLLEFKPFPVELRNTSDINTWKTDKSNTIDNIELAKVYKNNFALWRFKYYLEELDALRFNDIKIEEPQYELEARIRGLRRNVSYSSGAEKDRQSKDASSLKNSKIELKEFVGQIIFDGSPSDTDSIGEITSKLAEQTPRIVRGNNMYKISKLNLDRTVYNKLISMSNNDIVTFSGNTTKESSITTSGFLESPEWDITLTDVSCVTDPDKMSFSTTPLQSLADAKSPLIHNDLELLLSNYHTAANNRNTFAVSYFSKKLTQLSGRQLLELPVYTGLADLISEESESNDDYSMPESKMDAAIFIAELVYDEVTRKSYIVLDSKSGNINYKTVCGFDIGPSLSHLNTVKNELLPIEGGSAQITGTVVDINPKTKTVLILANKIQNDKSTFTYKSNAPSGYAIPY